MSDLKEKVRAAAKSGKLLASSAENICGMLDADASGIARESVAELVGLEDWQELNDRFFRTLAFGTGGLRGRTIGRVVTRAELGEPTELGRPEHPCVGTNAMNYFNVRRAAAGLVAYVKEWAAGGGDLGGRVRPLVVVAHDTRHFSREFAELVARVAIEMGCDAGLFDGPRSTPELSFAVRELGASAGVVITASHNPPHDNGFKAYFRDGAQVVEPHASAIIAKVNAVGGAGHGVAPEGERGELLRLGAEIDAAYMDRLETLVLDRALVAAQAGLKLVYTPIHGTGGVISVPMLRRLGFRPEVVEEQARMDGRFPTVESPNPENAEALAMAVARAEEVGADVAVATDPDCDRMGVVVRGGDGRLAALTGNEIGALLAWYRVKKLFELGVLNAGNASRAVLISTFVTSDLQKEVARRAGARCVETLTGFKYIGEKLEKYERALPPEDRARYRRMTEEESRRLRLERSSWFFFGAEESYGFSGADFVRDKDGNGAVVMFAEVAAYARSRGLTPGELMDEVYREFGYYHEKNASIYFEGAAGAEKIAKLAASYASEPPAEMDGCAVVGLRNFAADRIVDAEGDVVPPERMVVFDLADGRRVAVRPSGTEPKIKYYLFSRPKDGTLGESGDLAAVKERVRDAMERLWSWLKTDAERRASG